LRILSLLCVVACADSVMFASAQAGDLSNTTPPPVSNVPAVPPPLTWAGLYIGAHVGGAWTEADWNTPVTAQDAGSNALGLVGGGQLGYNWQIGTTVYGIEGDFSGTSLQSSNNSAGFTNTTSTHWTSTVAGRLGYMSDRALLYGKFGVAIADERDSVSSPTGALSSSTGTTIRPGWAAGGGVEYALIPHWSAKLEYDYLGFATHEVSAVFPVGTPGSVQLTIQKVTAGINFRF
jgi:outer membrane immunogenic protein